MPGKSDKGLLEGAALRLALPRIGRALHDDHAMIDDRDLLRHPLRLFHVVGGEKESDALVAAETPDDFPDLVARLGVEAARRLVEKENARTMLQCADNFEPALHAAGKALHIFVAAFPQTDEAQRRFLPLPAQAARGIVEDAV